MKFSIVTVLGLVASTSAFSVVRHGATRPRSLLRSSPSQDDIAALRAAAAKAREEAQKLSAVSVYFVWLFCDEILPSSQNRFAFRQ